jgi:hypothetical protein
VTPKQLLKRMRAVDKLLVYKKLSTKRQFTQPEKETREQVCNIMLRLGNEYYKRIFWIDESEIHLCKKGCSVFCSKCEDPRALIMEDNDIFKLADSICIRWYCCVNAIAGPVWIGCVTGTDYLEHRNYGPPCPITYQVKSQQLQCEAKTINVHLLPRHYAILSYILLDIVYVLFSV